MCGVEGKRRLCDLNVTSSSPALATRHIRCVLLVNSPNKLNLLSWLLIYLCNKKNTLHQAFKRDSTCKYSLIDIIVNQRYKLFKLFAVSKVSVLCNK